MRAAVLILDPKPRAKREPIRRYYFYFVTGTRNYSATMVTDRPFFNVIMLSVGFMLVFTAFQTMGNIEVSVDTGTHVYY